jgi:hypothetical protein
VIVLKPMIFVVAGVLCLYQSERAYADRGYINTKPAGCPNGDGAEVFDAQGQQIGAVPNKAVVTVDLLRRKPGYYWIQGKDIDWNNLISGYVLKDCVTMGAPPAQTGEPVVIWDPAVECSKFQEYLPGCKSFNEMLAARDKDIFPQLSSKSFDAFVCFQETEDVFTFISFAKPLDSGFRKGVSAGTANQYGTIKVTRFENGLSNQSYVFGGRWTRPAYSPASEASFTGVGYQRGLNAPNIFIDSNEISLSVMFKNVSGTTTTRSLQVRRSTKRMLETIEAPRRPADRGKSIFHASVTGHCEEYNSD